MPKYSQHKLFEKVAAPGVMGSLMRDPQFWAPTVAGAVAMGVGGIGLAISKVQGAKAKARSYKEMMEIHPHLKDRDQVLVNRIFTSLNHANPHMAKDPMVAGAWVDTIMDSAGLDSTAGASRALLSAVKDLAGIRAQTSQATKNEPNLARSMAAGANAHVMHAFGRARELDKEHGDLGVAHKQIGELQGKLKNKGISEATKATQDLVRAAQQAQQRGVNPDELIKQVYQKYSSTPGSRLLAAVSR